MKDGYRILYNTGYLGVRATSRETCYAIADIIDMNLLAEKKPVAIIKVKVKLTTVCNEAF